MAKRKANGKHSGALPLQARPAAPATVSPMRPEHLAELVSLVERIRLAKQEHSDVDRHVSQLEEVRRLSRLKVSALEQEARELEQRAAGAMGLDLGAGWRLDGGEGVFRRAPPT